MWVIAYPTTNQQGMKMVCTFLHYILDAVFILYV